jgi:uncharacterized protein YcbK (DUF882 family)
MTRPFAPIVNGVYLTSDGSMSHFRIEEMACHDGCGAFMVDQALIDTLEKIRKRLDVPIHVLSGVRCVRHNAEVEGKTRSQHLPRTPLTGEIVTASGTKDGAGRAADLTVRTMTAKRLQQFVRDNRAELGVHGLGCYAGFTHVDVRAISGFSEWA